jgi:hypothetical protein
VCYAERVSAALATRSSSASWRLPIALSSMFLLALPVLAARSLSGACADALGDNIASGLSSALGPVGSLLPRGPAADPLFETELSNQASALLAAPSVGNASPASRRARKLPETHAIRISSAQVLSLASRRAMPDAAPVLASASHPAGLLLRGVSALGVGLRDGDVLTEAGGQRASSVGAVVGVVLAARARHSSEISGRFFRGSVPYLITVEQPYPPGS